MSQPSAAAGAPTDALEIRDSRTGSTYSATIRTEGPEGDTYIRAADLKQVKREAGEFGTLSYDPAFMNTASCRSAITFIDGDKGILLLSAAVRGTADGGAACGFHGPRDAPHHGA